MGVAHVAGPVSDQVDENQALLLRSDGATSPPHTLVVKYGEPHHVINSGNRLKMRPRLVLPFVLGLVVTVQMGALANANEGHWQMRVMHSSTNKCRMDPVWCRNMLGDDKAFSFVGPQDPMLAPLELDGNLESLAVMHSTGMVSKNCIGHRSPAPKDGAGKPCTGTSSVDRLTKHSAYRGAVGENLVYGVVEPQDAVATMLCGGLRDGKSEDACAPDQPINPLGKKAGILEGDQDNYLGRYNIFNPDFNVVGSGYADGPRGFVRYYTQDYAHNPGVNSAAGVVSGAHYFPSCENGDCNVGDAIVFSANYFDAGTAPAEAQVVVDGRAENLEEASRGTYEWKDKVGHGCRSYHFLFTDAKGSVHRYPVLGEYRTFREVACTEVSAGVPSEFHHRKDLVHDAGAVLDLTEETSKLPSIGRPYGGEALQSVTKQIDAENAPKTATPVCKDCDKKTQMAVAAAVKKTKEEMEKLQKIQDGKVKAESNGDAVLDTVKHKVVGNFEIPSQSQKMAEEAEKLASQAGEMIKQGMSMADDSGSDEARWYCVDARKMLQGVKQDLKSYLEAASDCGEAQADLGTNNEGKCHGGPILARTVKEKMQQIKLKAGDAHAKAMKAMELVRKCKSTAAQVQQAKVEKLEPAEDGSKDSEDGKPKEEPKNPYASSSSNGYGDALFVEVSVKELRGMYLLSKTNAKFYCEVRIGSTRFLTKAATVAEGLKFSTKHVFGLRENIKSMTVKVWQVSEKGSAYDMYIAETKIDLTRAKEELDRDHIILEWFNLGQTGNKGEVLVQLKYPTEDGQSAASGGGGGGPSNPGASGDANGLVGQLTMELMDGRNVRASGAAAKTITSFFCTMQVGEQQYSTPPVNFVAGAGTNVKINAKHTFNVAESSKSVDMYCYGSHSNGDPDTLLGEATINLDTVVKDKWYVIKKDDTTGCEIRVDASFKQSDGASAVAKAEKCGNALSPLEIVCVEARGFTKQGFGNSDVGVSCEMIIGPQRYMTKSIKGTANPVWDEECKFVEKDPACGLDVSVWAQQESSSGTSLLGEKTISFDDILNDIGNSPSFSHWYRINKDDPLGEVKLAFRYKPDVTTSNSRTTNTTAIPQTIDDGKVEVLSPENFKKLGCKKTSSLHFKVIKGRDLNNGSPDFLPNRRVDSMVRITMGDQVEETKKFVSLPDPFWDEKFTLQPANDNPLVVELWDKPIIKGIRRRMLSGDQIETSVPSENILMGRKVFQINSEAVTEENVVVFGWFEFRNPSAEHYRGGDLLLEFKCIPMSQNAQKEMAQIEASAETIKASSAPIDPSEQDAAAKAKELLQRSGQISTSTTITSTHTVKGDSDRVKAKLAQLKSRLQSIKDKKNNQDQEYGSLMTTMREEMVLENRLEALISKTNLSEEEKATIIQLKSKIQTLHQSSQIEAESAGMIGHRQARDYNYQKTLGALKQTYATIDASKSFSNQHAKDIIERAMKSVIRNSPDESKDVTAKNEVMSLSKLTRTLKNTVRNAQIAERMWQKVNDPSDDLTPEEKAIAMRTALEDERQAKQAVDIAQRKMENIVSDDQEVMSVGSKGDNTQEYPQVYVKLIEGKKFHDGRYSDGSDVFGRFKNKVDSYVVAKLGDQSFRTKVILASQIPKWDEDTRFRLVNSTLEGGGKDFVDVTVWDWDREGKGRDQMVGRVRIPVPLGDTELHDNWYTVSNGAYGGFIRVVLGFEPGTKDCAHKCPRPESPVGFNDTVVKRMTVSFERGDVSAEETIDQTADDMISGLSESLGLVYSRVFLGDDGFKSPPVFLTNFTQNWAINHHFDITNGMLAAMVPLEIGLWKWGVGSDTVVGNVTSISPDTYLDEKVHDLDTEVYLKDGIKISMKIKYLVYDLANEEYVLKLQRLQRLLSAASKKAKSDINISSKTKDLISDTEQSWDVQRFKAHKALNKIGNETNGVYSDIKEAIAVAAQGSPFASEDDTTEPTPEINPETEDEQLNKDGPLAGMLGKPVESATTSPLNKCGDKDITYRQCAENGEGDSIVIRCPEAIASVCFASFGTPKGECKAGNFLQQGACHAPLSEEKVTELCVGKKECVLPVDRELFQYTDCAEQKMRLAVDFKCTTPLFDPNFAVNNTPSGSPS